MVVADLVWFSEGKTTVKHAAADGYADYKANFRKN